jgi:hypothetical protein
MAFVKPAHPKNRSAKQLSHPALILVHPVTGFHVASVHSIVVVFAMAKPRSERRQ